MTDVTAAALWMATFGCAAFGGAMRSRASVCGLALLGPSKSSARSRSSRMSPNRDQRSGSRDHESYAVFLAAFPFGLVVLWLNNGLYGSPFEQGTDSSDSCSDFPRAPVNASRYLGWLVETHTPFPLLALAAPFVVAREHRADPALAIGLILATCLDLLLLYAVRSVVVRAVSAAGHRVDAVCSQVP